MSRRLAHVALRQRGFSDVVDLTVRFLSEHRTAYLRITLWTYAPLTLALGLCAHLDSTWVATWVLVLLSLSAVTLPFTILTARLVFGEQPSMREVLRVCTACLPSVLGIRLVRALSILVGAFPLLFPALYVDSRTLFATEVRTLERLPLRSTLRRCKWLSEIGGGELFLLSVTLLLAPPVLVVLGDVVGRETLRAFDVRPPLPVWTTGKSVPGLVSLGMGLPFLAALRFFFYVNVRTYAEGWDIQTRFSEMAARPLTDSGRAQ